MTSPFTLHPDQYLPEDMTNRLMKVRKHIDLLHGTFTFMEEVISRLSKNYQGKSFHDDRYGNFILLFKDAGLEFSRFAESLR